MEETDGADPQLRDRRQRYLKSIKAGWKNEKHSLQWMSLLEAHAFPTLGSQTVDQITAADVQAALLPIWLTIPEIGRRIRQRSCAVLDFSHSQGRRAGEAPVKAISKGLPKQPKRDGQCEAMPYPQLPKYIQA